MDGWIFKIQTKGEGPLLIVAVWSGAARSCKEHQGGAVVSTVASQQDFKFHKVLNNKNVTTQIKISFLQIPLPTANCFYFVYQKALLCHLNTIIL